MNTKTYTIFYDMSSGGVRKEDFKSLAVSLKKDEAIKWFEEKFGHHPYCITCDCCGEDYDVSESTDPEEINNTDKIIEI